MKIGQRVPAHLCCILWIFKLMTMFWFWTYLSAPIRSWWQLWSSASPLSPASLSHWDLLTVICLLLHVSCEATHPPECWTLDDLLIWEPSPPAPSMEAFCYGSHFFSISINLHIFIKILQLAALLVLCYQGGGSKPADPCGTLHCSGIHTTSPICTKTGGSRHSFNISSTN